MASGITTRSVAANRPRPSPSAATAHTAAADPAAARHQLYLLLEHDLQHVYWKLLARDCDYIVAEMARRCGVSPRHFQRLANRTLGETPREWIYRIRMVEARHLLLHAPSAKSVAFLLKYKQAAHFTRQFKACYTLTPTAFVALARRSPVHALLAES